MYIHINATKAGKYPVCVGLGVHVCVTVHVRVGYSGLLLDQAVAWLSFRGPGLAEVSQGARG